MRAKLIIKVYKQVGDSTSRFFEARAYLKECRSVMLGEAVSEKFVDESKYLDLSVIRMFGEETINIIGKKKVRSALRKLRKETERLALERAEENLRRLRKILD